MSRNLIREKSLPIFKVFQNILSLEGNFVFSVLNFFHSVHETFKYVFFVASRHLYKTINLISQNRMINSINIFAFQKSKNNIN